MIHPCPDSFVMHGVTFLRLHYSGPNAATYSAVNPPPAADPKDAAVDRLNRAEVARIAARDALAAAESEAASAARAVAEAEEAARVRKSEQHAAAYRELIELGRVFENTAAARGTISGVAARHMIYDAIKRVEQAGK
jgi:hypothetical protein